MIAPNLDKLGTVEEVASAFCALAAIHPGYKVITTEIEVSQPERCRSNYVAGRAVRAVVDGIQKRVIVEVTP